MKENIIKKVTNSFLYLLLTIIIILNFSSGIVGGIWLLVLKDWPIIVLGLLYGFFMPWVFSLAYLPTMGLSAVMFNRFEKKKYSQASMLGFIISLYDNILILAWVLFVFFYVALGVKGSAYIPYMLWGYSVAISPLSYMASKEEKSIGTFLGVLIAQIGYFLLVILYFTIGIRIDFLLLLVLIFSIISSRFMDKFTKNINEIEPELPPLPTNNVYCPNCGKENLVEASFCKYCGKKIKEV